MMKSMIAAAMIFAAPAAFAQAGGDMTPNTVDVIEAASASDQYSKLLDAVMKADLAQTLATTRNVTIFAPINAAFESASGVPTDKARLANVLKMHVVPTAYLSSAVPNGETEVRTLAGEMLTIVNTGGSISVKTPSGDTAMVVQPDIRADNGVVHGINKVLMP